jgi:hypothetical protein
MKPEKLTELMLKLRKGAWGSLKMDVVDQVLSSLGGWKVEEMLYLAPTAYNDDNLSWYSSSNPNEVKAHWDKAKTREVTRLPTPDQLSPSDENQVFCMEVGEIQPHPKTGEMGFYQKEWQVTPGTRVIAPNGKDFKAKESLSIFFNSHPTNLWSLTNVDWMKKDPTRDAQPPHTVG